MLIVSIQKFTYDTDRLAHEKNICQLFVGLSLRSIQLSLCIRIGRENLVQHRVNDNGRTKQVPRGMG